MSLWMREREDRGGGSRSMHSSVKVSDTAVQPEWSYLQKKARQIIEHQCSLCNRIMRPRERERERDREREMGTAVHKHFSLPISYANSDDVDVPTTASKVERLLN
ncbi:hypothetical protein SORBI_3004G205400 [Sorghum bicolor]|uniref:Uncharacterized protein n=1 Tax=Sorghum bicolor TaxID=4558 RepID=A0A194YQV0_SORBI|nr:hypothetical protein SORBI_3004G205400 [Sorghum bicolor]